MVYDRRYSRTSYSNPRVNEIKRHYASCPRMKALELLGQTLTPDGTDMKLARRVNEYIILANGKSLMSSRMHGSEEALATFACRRARTMEQPCVLVGGLGMGFTLRATLDCLPYPLRDGSEPSVERKPQARHRR